MRFINKVLNLAATLEGYEAYSVEGYDGFGYIITPDGNVLTANRGDFGGVRFTFNYIPSKENGMGCSCNDDALYEITPETLKVIEKEGLEYATKLHAKLYKNSGQWLKGCYWADKLRRIGG